MRKYVISLALLLSGAVLVVVLLVPSPMEMQDEAISASRVSERLGDSSAPLVLDVRTEREYEAGHVPGALHIPHTELAARLTELPVDKTGQIVVYCEQGPRASMAEDLLADAGFVNVRTLEGHMANWRSEGYPME